MVEKTGDHRASQRSLAHVSDRLIVNHIIAVAGTQQLKEVEAALGARGAEPSEVVVANLCAMRTDHQILNYEAGVALEARPGRGAALTVFSSWIVSFDLVLPRLPSPSPAGLSGFGSVAFSMPLGLIFGRSWAAF
jgi:hypothetical protein